MTDRNIGLYLHIPFCRSKCPYCDFYSFIPGEDMLNKYTETLCRRIDSAGGTFDTVYFGGGTPSILSAERISEIMRHISYTPDAEITIEANPSHVGKEGCSFDFELLKKSGVNRVSLGLQSAVDSERRSLGRTAGVEEVSRAMDRLHKAGIDNISLDLMLGVPDQTMETLDKSLEYCVNSGAKHISIYILKLEEGTVFWKRQDKLNLPVEDMVCEMYLHAVRYMESHGFIQYEISNFCLPGYESKHNLKYWHDDEYLGLGPSAHSFVNGKRFYFDRDINAFIDGCEPVSDGDGGDSEEYVMLALRLREGLDFEKFKYIYGYDIYNKIKPLGEKLEKSGLAEISKDRIRLTPEGFLISNEIIGNIIELI